MKINWLKIAGQVMTTIGALGIISTLFSAPMMIAGESLGYISDSGGPSMWGIILWEGSIVLFSTLNIVFGNKLVNNQSKENLNKAIIFQLIYLLGFNIILTIAFGLEFIKALGFIGASILPIVGLIPLVIGHLERKKGVKHAK